MHATQIERFNLPALADDPQRKMLVDLGQQANTVLGYARLAQTFTSGTLLNALTALGISPLVTQHVESYKASKIKVYPRASFFHLMAAWFGVVAAAVGCFFLSPYIDVAGAWHRTIGVVGLVLGGVSVVGFVVGCVVTFSGDRHVTPRNIRHWKEWNIKEYAGSIPEFVLNDAIRIKQACPEVQLFVQQLVVEQDPNDRHRIDSERERIMRLRDPFLVVRLVRHSMVRGKNRYGDPVDTQVETSREEFYTHVWDERDYEKTL